MVTKCYWALSSPIEERYHDHEWGVPIIDDRLLFEFLILEGAQAGLSWVTILKKRDGYRAAFDNFNVETVAGYDQEKIDQLLINPNIIRNRLKINAAVVNAKAFIQVQQEFGSFSKYLWQFVDNKQIQNVWQKHADLPASTPLSEMISKDLKKRGFKFVGSTICYALMQAVGLVNDHTTDCFRHAQVRQLAEGKGDY
jgi:DNA-3-methyladenine glycosylase I